jgi:hypothetical protein
MDTIFLPEDLARDLGIVAVEPAQTTTVRNAHPSREKYRTRLKEIARRLGPLTALSGSSRNGTWSAAQSAELARRLVEVVTLLDEALTDPDVGSLP